MTPNEPETAAPNNSGPSTPRTGPTGPRTPAGKSRCRFNAVTHGLTQRTLVFEASEAHRYREHCAAIRNHYRPVGPIEEALAGQIADGIYRLDRASAIEHGIFALTLADPPADLTPIELGVAPARTWLEDSKSLALLTLYVRRIENKLAANKTELGTLQTSRGLMEKERENEAAALAAKAKTAAEPSSVANPESSAVAKPESSAVAKPESSADAESVFSVDPAAGSPAPIHAEILDFIAPGLAKSEPPTNEKDTHPEAA